jgi:hypothetical protein
LPSAGRDASAVQLGGGCGHVQPARSKASDQGQQLALARFRLELIAPRRRGAVAAKIAEGLFDVL